MPSQEQILPFPMGGLSTRLGYQNGDKQTTRDASNVVPDDSQESRTRGGSRPGLTRRYSTSVGGQPDYMLRVSGGESTRAYEFLVVGTSENAFIGQSIASGEVVPISYTEQLSPLSGDLCIEDGSVLTTEDDENIVINDFTILDVDRAQLTDYRGGLIFGAPVESVVTDTDGAMNVSSGQGVLTDAGIADWTVFDIDPAVHIVEIIAAANVTSGTYLIDSVATGGITLVENPFHTGTGPQTVTYTVRRGIRQLDPITPNLTIVTPTAGIAPSGADAVAVYRDRIVWGVGRNWLMSRQGDPGDYDYAADPEDPARAIAGSASDAGQPGDPIVALVPGGFDYLVMFGENSTWNLRGDPGYGGQLYQLSTSVGCIASQAWTYGESTEIYFLAKDGLYVLAANASGSPRPISPQSLPRSLRGVDRDNNHVSMAYDSEDRGVLLCVTPKTGTAGQHWWFDVATESFWPVKFSNNSHQPVDLVTFGGSPQRVRRLVFACFDGVIREWLGTSDDGTAISSYVVLGPYDLADGNDNDGILTQIRTVLDDTSGDLTVGIYTGRTSEEATNAAIAGTSPRSTITAKAGRGPIWRPRSRDRAFCVRLSGTSPWSLESISAMIAVSGKIR